MHPVQRRSPAPHVRCGPSAEPAGCREQANRFASEWTPKSWCCAKAALAGAVFDTHRWDRLDSSACAHYADWHCSTFWVTPGYGWSIAGAWQGQRFAKP